jgi:hypothetical protein
MSENGESSLDLLTWSVSELERSLRRSNQVSRVESSFCSKLVATYHPEAAVIDSVVLKQFNIPSLRAKREQVPSLMRSNVAIGHWRAEFLR